jgi:hypothetical protein
MNELTSPVFKDFFQISYHRLLMVFLFNGLSKHNWLEAFLFVLAVARRLPPEMLPNSDPNHQNLVFS